MRSLLAPLILALALAVLCCCEEGKGMSIKREVANAFMRRQKRSSMYEWYFEYYKSPMEQMRERCENYLPCGVLSEQIGFPMAYNRYFGRY
uniref:Bone gamma-carboxyglutamate protein n=1 Tax=Nothoprocta perdicaria TaxID=30464 RepID=A0A8C6Z6X9_NOTPE